MSGRRYVSFLFVACAVAWALVASSVQPLAVAAKPAAAARSPKEAADSDGDGRPDASAAGSAAVAARKLRTRVEDLSQRTPTRQVFINPDGTWTKRLSAGPVRARDPQSGKWAPISTTLVETEDGWRPANALGEMAFSDGGGGPLVQMRDAAGKDVSWSWPTVLPRPTVKGSTLTYPDVVPNGDLVVKALPDGFSHSIVLRAAPTGQLRLPMLVEADGAKVTMGKHGTLTIRARDGKPVLSAPAPLMWDAKADRGAQPNRTSEPGVSRPRPVEVAVTAAGKGERVVLTPDVAFLADPETEYPVTIDPTYTLSPVVGVEVNQADLDLSQATGAYTVGRYPGGQVSRLLLDFGGVTSAGETVTAATLSLPWEYSTDCAAREMVAQRVTSAWSGPVAWASQPTVSTADEVAVVQPASTGPSCQYVPSAPDTWDVTSIAQAWAAGAPDHGLRVMAADEAASAERQYTVGAMTLTVTGSGAPLAAAAPTPSDSQTWDGDWYTRNATPEWTTRAIDPDGTPVRMIVEVHESDSATSEAVASCTTDYVASGSEASCVATVANPQPGADPRWLPNGTYYLRARADDGTLDGAWSEWRKTIVNYDKPDPVSLVCPGIADEHWYATRPATKLSCTVASAGAAQIEVKVNGGSGARYAADAAGAITRDLTSIPTSGWTTVEVRGLSNSGMGTAWVQLGFGTGTGALISPRAGATSATTFEVEAAGATGIDSAVLQWRAGSTDVWKTAIELVTRGGTTWDGSLEDNGFMSSTPALTWRPAAEDGMTIPSSIQTQVVFTDGAVVTATPARTLTIAAHAAGNAAPTVSVGPGEVQLGTGEFQTGAVDVSIGAMAVSRSHLSDAPVASGASGVFGPGWSGSVEVGGPASYTVTDQRGSSSSLLFTTTDGTVYTYRGGIPATATLSGDFAPEGDAVALDAKVHIESGTGLLTYTEPGAVVTTFERIAGRWLPISTVGPAEASTTNYYYDNGLPSWIIAPAPTGLTCTPASLPTGCQALHLTYTTVNGAARVASVDYSAWEPMLTDADGDAGSDGLPDTNAGVTATTVAKYAYNSDGTLQAVWDPRIADGAAALKTAYTYIASGGKTRVATITPPGEKIWQITYASDGAVATVTRQLDPAVGTGNATWTIKYGLKLNAEGDGLPNLSAAKTAAWGQPAADGPATGAAVFGPDKVPGTQPSADDWTYAVLYYWNSEGRLTNTASYGGGWQITSSRYDASGNETWSLSPAAKAQAIADGAGDAGTSSAAADRYATWSIYNADGTRVEAEYGTTITALTKDNVSRTIRTLTQYTYDDEPDAPASGRPTTGVPEGGYGLVTEVRSSATEETTPGTWTTSQINPPAGVSVYDTVKTRYRYDPARLGDLSGWNLYQPTAVLQQMGTGWDTTSYSYNAAGQVIQERTPEGVATGQQTRWHDIVYYTADASASRNECDDKPQWAGVVCWEGPHAQPTTGQPIPTTSYPGYSRDLAPTRQVTASGTAAKVVVAGHDAAGRPTTTSTSATGVSGAAITTTIGYSTTTGQPVTVTNGAATMTTGYDTWGRVTSQTDGAGNTATTSYNASGNVATFNDGKGTYTYGYDQTISGKVDRRGMVTSLNAGIAGVNPIEASYDADGQLTTQDYGAYASGTTTRRPKDVLEYNLAGHQTSRGFDATSSFAFLDVNGRTRIGFESGDSASGLVDSKYTYDDRGRLTAVNDGQYFGNECTRRTYTLTADSNRTSLTSGADCYGSAPLAVTTSTYDSADRITNPGYAYDDLGRTTTLPAADTNNPTGSALTATYQVNDMVKTLTQGTTTETYTLDPLGRISTKTQTVAGVDLAVTTNHYADTSDNPAWTEFKSRPNASTAWTTTWTRYVRGIDGGLAITQASGQTPKAWGYNLHGDLIGGVNLGAGAAPAPYANYTEFGGLRSGSASPGRYGWLGSAQRDTDTLGGLTLMGARLYNPITGRFLSRDPIRGANDNSYAYPSDPVNVSDLSGAEPSRTRDLSPCDCPGYSKPTGDVVFGPKSDWQKVERGSSLMWKLVYIIEDVASGLGIAKVLKKAVILGAAVGGVSVRNIYYQSRSVSEVWKSCARVGRAWRWQYTTRRIGIVWRYKFQVNYLHEFSKKFTTDWHGPYAGKV